jgi:hypothetical protein
MVAQVGCSVAGRSKGRVTPCAVCTWHMETRSTGFLVEPQNQGRRFSLVWSQNQWRRFSPVWPQNWWRRFLPVWPQNRRWVSWLSLKTKVVEGFPVWASKPLALVLSHPVPRKRERSLHTCVQDVQITHTANNMVNRYNISLNFKLESLQNDPWVQKKHYRVARKSKSRCIFHRHNRRRGRSSLYLLAPDGTLGFDSNI